MTRNVGIVDTTFARVDMAKFALNELRKHLPAANVERTTVPGIKDIPGAVKRIIEEKECQGVITFGWVGAEKVDKYSYLATSTALMWLELTTSAIIVDVTIHEDEAEKEKELYKIAEDRSRKHTRNLVLLLTDPEKLTKLAGKGKRQGYPDEGPIKPQNTFTSEGS